MAKGEEMRPYWQVDVKWVFGIIFTIGLFVTTFLYSLSVISSQKVFVPIASYFVATQFSRNGLDDAKEVEELKKKFGTQKEIRPIPQSDVTITKEDLLNLTPRQLRLKIFEQVVSPIYSQKRTKETMSQYGFLAFLNYETHDSVNLVFKLSLIPLFLSGFGLLWFSHKHGKFLSFAVSFLIVGIVPAISLYVIKLTGTSFGNLSFPIEVVSVLVPPLLKVYGGLVFAGFVLVIAAAITAKLWGDRQ